jgi:hypothetical protein
MKGLHSEALGIKKIGKPPVDYITDLIVAEVTFNPPSLTTLTGAVSSEIDIDGAELGDRVELFPPYDTEGVIFQGFVSASGKVKISLFNPTGGTIDLDEGDWIVKVVRP